MRQPPREQSTSALASGVSSFATLTQTERTNDQRPSTTNPINNEESKDQGTDKLDRAVDTGSEERVLGSTEAELLEDSGTVVVDGLDTRESLEEDQSKTETNPLSVTLGGGELLDQTPQSRIASDGSLGLDRVVGHLDLVLDVVVVGGKSSDVDKRLERIVVSTLAHEPSRSFRDEEGTDTQKRSGAVKGQSGPARSRRRSDLQELHKNGQLPLEGVGGQGGVDTVVDPETSQCSDLNEDIEETDQSASNRWGSEFGKVDGDDQRQETDGETTLLRCLIR